MHRRKDGSTFPVEVSSRIMEIEGVPFRQSIIRDITERKRAEEEIRRNRHFLSQILEATPNLLYIYDLAEHRNVYANRQATANLGYSPEQLQAMGANLFASIAHPDDLPGIDEHHRKLAAAPDGAVFEIEYRLRHADGSWRWLHSRDVPFARDGDGGTRQILGAAEDISERKRAEEERAWEARTNEAVADLGAALLSQSSIQEISALVLSRAKALTGSSLGLVGYIDVQTGNMVVPAPAGRDGAFRETGAMWRWVVENKRPLLANDAAAFAGSTGASEGSITRFLGVPAMMGEVVAGQLALANPDRDYTQHDLTVMERLARLYAIAVLRMRDELALRSSEASLARAQRIAHLGSWEADLATSDARWSDEVYRIFGLAPGPSGPSGPACSITFTRMTAKPSARPASVAPPPGSPAISSTASCGRTVRSATSRVIRRSCAIAPARPCGWSERCTT